ncbi:inositol hexakisphosphate and diphosphoinositol-pentakisphosphate kinase 2-like isoform X3 [Symsagittifera roscoffensis]|uniref:inositol hexakisphosphate and diphosphoinositol-pentakisphosphate kinase 2-like isoform X3 n=1 Tax=Symsagittifera roscoffensis TaxID=84072 RepID=UPI00307C6BF8
MASNVLEEDAIQSKIVYNKQKSDTDMVSISVPGCGFKPVQASPVPGQGEDEEGSCDLEFMDNSCDGEGAIKQANSEESLGSNSEKVHTDVTRTPLALKSKPITISLQRPSMSNDLNTVTIPTKETLNPLQSESGGVDEYRSQTKFKKYVSNFRENNSDRSINVGKSELAVSSEKFFANLELPVCAPLSSSVPTSSYGDQEDVDQELMQYTSAIDDTGQLQTRRNLEIAARTLRNAQHNLTSQIPMDPSGITKELSPGDRAVNLDPSSSAAGALVAATGSGSNIPSPVGNSVGSSLPPSAPLSRASSRSDADGITDEDEIDEIPAISLGICAMQKKTDSKPMKQILTRLKVFDYLNIVIFQEDVILNEPVDKWPVVDCLISFFSTDFPLDKAIEYVKLRQPFCLNDLTMQKVLFDRREVYKILQKEGLPVPRYAVLDRRDPNFSDDQVVEDDDQITINGKVFKKPFVEKPMDAEDHNVTIYFQSSAGGGCQRLFRKIGSVSSTYSSDSTVRKQGSYIYEEFKPTDGCDVKVYAVGSEYAHAEARKAPGLDGRVERDTNGKEVRYPVLLSHFEKFIARTISLAFKQTVCGFDLLRANGKSFICDVNGFSFVKNNSKYYDDCAKIISTILLKHMAPDFNIPLHLTVLNEEIPVVPTTRGTMMELRCVIGVIRHGDRQPKQKMKMEVFHQSFFDLFAKFGGSFTVATKSKIKLKQPRELQAILDTVLSLLEASENKDSELKENLHKLEQLKSVLQMYGYFSGINRKVQMKCLKNKPKASSSEDERTVNQQSILLIAKWGGELTPLGRVHAEALGKAFRCMYPGGSSYNDDGSGLLRLHSTFRHDLKIYASDEGRVQMTAAAFAKGLLALDGELTPILVHMVKCAKTNALLDHDESTDEAGDPIASQEDIKVKLKRLFGKDEKFTAEDAEALAPTGSHSLRNSIEVIGNPVQLCESVYQMIQKVAAQIRHWAVVPNKFQNLTLYNSESFEMMARRWSKLEKDFKTRCSDKHHNVHCIPGGSGGGEVEYMFDISKIPDIYDCIKYDALHNSHLPLPCQNELYAASKALADVIVPQEYGMTANEKFKIALKLCTPLLRKIRCDLQRNLDQSAYRLHPKYSENILTPNRQVRTRLYFTSESHIHSLVNIIRYGGLFPDPDKEWAAADKYLSTVTELNYLSHLVFLLYEDPTKDLKSEERYKLEVQFSPGIRYWEETSSYPIGSKFYPKSPPNIHETSAKEILSYSSSAKTHTSAPASSKKHAIHTLKVTPAAGSSSTSDLTNIQQRGRHRSVENLQRRSSSGNSNGTTVRVGASDAAGAAAPQKPSPGHVSSANAPASTSTKRTVTKNTTRKKDGAKTVAGRNLATPTMVCFKIAFLSGNVNSGSAPNLSSIYQEKMRRENMLPTAIITSKLLKDFCPVEVLHNNLNVGQLERFLDHVTENREGVKTPPMFPHSQVGIVAGGRSETIIEETDSKIREFCGGEHEETTKVNPSPLPKLN